MLYADPTLCPDCRSPLPVDPQSCPVCTLPVRGPLVAELFRTLQHADVLVARLRVDSLRADVALDTPTESLADALRAFPRPAGTEAGRRRGIRTASVPTILLGLGALCLIVAAITFLAVAWAWMGVGGRTGVLVALTAAAAGVGGWLGRRGLRVAAESLTTVSLGLVALDVAGAITAGWLGAPDDAASFALVGSGVAAVSGGLVLPRSRLVAPQVGTVLGLSAAAAGVAVTTGHDRLVAFVAVLALVAVGALGRLAAARVLDVAATVAAGTWWAWLLLAGLDDAGADLSFRALWAEAGALALVGATALLLLPVVLVPGRPQLSRGFVAGAATLLTATIALPALDEGGTAVVATALTVLVVWSALTRVLPAAWRPVAGGPLALAALVAVPIAAALVLTAAVRVGTVGSPFDHPLGVRLTGVEPPLFDPLLLLPLVLALVLAVRALRPQTPLHPVGTALVGVAAVATLASYAVPLAVVVAVLSLLAVALASLATPAPARAVTAAGLATVSIAAALPSAGLTVATCAAAVTAAGLLLRWRATTATVLGGLLAPASAAGLLWSVGEVADVAVALRAVPVLVVIGLVAIARPRPETEASAALTGMLAALASIDAATDEPTALAIHLTVAGVLVTLSGLLHPGRRVLAWPGGLLLAAATWVRLADVGVEAPEAYTLPSAVVLVLVALHRLWRAPAIGTAVLLPGLTLATVPSLLWVLADPVSPRAVLLGAACLGLVLAGTRLRWSAPLAVGGLVGALLVLRELAPYAGNTPQWVLIGLAGTVLTVVGVTWEQRLLELRRAAGYLGRLR